MTPTMTTTAIAQVYLPPMPNPNAVGVAAEVMPEAGLAASVRLSAVVSRREGRQRRNLAGNGP